MLGILGDIHGGLAALKSAAERCKEQGAVALIQVGDFGFDTTMLAWIRDRVELAVPVYAIDGNHEHHDLVEHYTEVTELAPNLYFVPRGTALELDGRRIVFLGGAGSIDKAIRLRQGMHWSPTEEVTQEQCDRTIALGGKVDLMITHTPPQRTITKHFETPEGIKFKVGMFGVAPDWSEPSPTFVEAAWVSLGMPPLYCGHMHRKVQDGKIRILDINEVAFV